MSKKLTKALVKLILEHKPNYDELAHAVREARKETGLKPPTRNTAEKPLIKLADMKKFFAEVEKEDAKIRLMMKIMAFMGFRNEEITNLKINFIDLTPNHEIIFVERKNGRNLNFAIPSKLVDLLKVYMENLTSKGQTFLFEHGFHKQYSTRGIRKIVERNANRAEVSGFYPHAFRHRLISFLGEKGWTDRQISCVSGHTLPGNVSVYSRKRPESIRTLLNEAIDEYAGLVR